LSRCLPKRLSRPCGKRSTGSPPGKKEICSLEHSL
jgi:hypothetical protein